MRAVRYRDGEVAVTDVAPVREGTRIRVAAAGICGSDLHLISSPGLAPTVTLGHEVAGVTDDGTPVAVEPLAPCGSCPPCLAGE